MGKWSIQGEGFATLSSFSTSRLNNPAVITTGLVIFGFIPKV